MLGIILNHLEALGQVVQSTAEVGFPSGLVVGEIIDLPTCYCPRLEKHVRFGSHGGKSSVRQHRNLVMITPNLATNGNTSTHYRHCLISGATRTFPCVKKTLLHTVSNFLHACVNYCVIKVLRL